MKRHIHLEITVKFYLGAQDASTWKSPGPNLRDNWHRKLARMQTHQFQLGKTDEAQGHLSERLNIQQIETQQLVYGRLLIESRIASNQFLNRNYATGL